MPRNLTTNVCRCDTTLEFERGVCARCGRLLRNAVGTVDTEAAERHDALALAIGLERRRKRMAAQHERLEREAVPA